MAPRGPYEVTGVSVGDLVVLEEEVGMGESNLDLKNWIYRCYALGTETVMGGLIFSIKDDEVILSGLDYESITGSRYRLEDEYLHVKIPTNTTPLSITIDLPVEDYVIDWKEIARDINRLSKMLSYRYNSAYLTVKYLKKVQGYTNINTIVKLSFPDVVMVEDRAFQDSTLDILELPKVKILGKKCFCNTRIHNLDLSKLSVLGKGEIENLRYINGLHKLQLAKEYTILDDGIERLRNGREAFFVMLDLDKFKKLSRHTLQYLFTHKSSVSSESLEEVHVTDSELYRGRTPDTLLNSKIYTRKCVDYINFPKLKEVPSYMFTGHKNSVRVFLDSVTLLNDYSFSVFRASVLYLPNCKMITDKSFGDYCSITELCLIGMDEIDLKWFDKNSINIKHLYIGEHTHLINSNYRGYEGSVERMSKEDAERFAGLYR